MKRKAFFTKVLRIIYLPLYPKHFILGHCLLDPVFSHCEGKTHLNAPRK